jgi:nitrogen-specific signal transduction histidine kinase/CheY-like chemotaxis protein
LEANRRLAVEVKQRERAEEELLQKRKIEAIGQLAAGVAHDFNNLLTAVIGNLDLLRNKLTGELRRLANSAFHAAERGATLTGHLLAFGRRQRLEKKPVSLNVFVESVAPLLRHVVGPLIEFELKLGVLSGVVVLDHAQMELALLNLALNARDAMPKGGRIVVETRSLRVTAQQEHAVVGPGDWTELCVVDTGAGMTAEVKARAFDPFFTTKEVGKGTGLGLSVVHGLVKQLNAEIAISSEVGRGTAVRIYFPRAEPDEAKPPGTVPTRSALPAGRILVVDDDPDALQFLVALLEGAGHKTAWATSGRAALELIDPQDPPSLVVLDYAMPEMNGLAAAREMRARLPNVSILFVTGLAEDPGLEGEEVLFKPFKPDRLLDRVRGLLIATAPDL